MKPDEKETKLTRFWLGFIICLVFDALAFAGVYLKFLT